MAISCPEASALWQSFQSLSLTNFSPPLPWYSLNLEWGEVMCYQCLFKAGSSPVIYFLYVLVLTSAHWGKKKLLWWGPKAALICAYKEKCLECTVSISQNNGRTAFPSAYDLLVRFYFQFNMVWSHLKRKLIRKNSLDQIGPWTRLKRLSWFLTDKGQLHSPWTLPSLERGSWWYKNDS